MVKTLLKRSTSHFAGLFVGKVLSTGLLIILARMLMPEKFGLLVLFITFVQFTTALADFGLKQWYQTKAHLFNKSAIFRQALHARLLTYIVSLLALLLMLVIWKPFSLISSGFLLLIIFPDGLLSLAEAYWLERRQSFKVGLRNPLVSLIIAVGWALLQFTTDFDQLTMLWFLGSFSTLIWFFPWNEFVLSKFSLVEQIRTLSESSKYALLTTSAIVYSRGDQMIIQRFAGSAALGIYAAAYRFIDGINLLSNAVSMNVFPEAAKKGNIKLVQLIKLTLLMGALGIIVGLLLSLSSDLLVIGILGHSYIGTIPLLKIFSILIILFFINAPLSSVVQSSEVVKKFLPWGIGNTVINLILNLVLVPIYGIAGAAWIMVLTEGLGFLINLYFVKKVYD